MNAVLFSFDYIVSIARGGYQLFAASRDFSGSLLQLGQPYGKPTPFSKDSPTLT